MYSICTELATDGYLSRKLLNNSLMDACPAGSSITPYRPYQQCACLFDKYATANAVHCLIMKFVPVLLDRLSLKQSRPGVWSNGRCFI